MERIIDDDSLEKFREWLRNEDKSPGTIEKYLRDLSGLRRWLDRQGTGQQRIDRETGIRWREYLMEAGYSPVTVNSKIAALNTFLCFAGWNDCRVRFLKIQKRLFREESRELTRKDYEHLISEAYSLGKDRLALVMETMCAAGIRVGEVRYITAEAAKRGKAEIAWKGKIRTILLPKKLCRKLLEYAKKNKIASGELFLTRSGRSLSRKQIWADMKRLCEKTGVERSKVFPHNLRHLFAQTFYNASRDVAKLADVLGHSSIETTRIYLISSETEHTRQLDRLDLVC